MTAMSHARNIISAPEAEWPVIAAEPADIAGLYTGYIAVLALIPLIAELIHLLFAGESFGVSLALVVSAYVMSLIDVAILAIISSKLAPMFDGVDDINQGFKLAAYAATPGWIGGIFLLVPWVGGLLRFLCGIYGIYVYYRGISDLMRVPAERRIGYLVMVFVVIVLAAFGLGVILTLLTHIPLGTMVLR
jgi:hypothetical protein